jgi:6-methylsalicylate decarboxylase
VLKSIKEINKLVNSQPAGVAGLNDQTAMKIDVHQHLWSEPLVRALEQRRELPFVRNERGLTVLFLAGERPYVIDLSSEAASRRAELVWGDGLDRAFVCLSSPLGIESLPREQAVPLIDAYHEGALSLPEPFGAWGALALDRPDPDDVDALLDRGCVGLSLPAGALANVDALTRLRAVLARLERRGAPLLVHPGPGLAPGRLPSRLREEPSLGDPLWWSALTSYVADMHSAWLAFLSAGRSEHPELRVVFTMLAGLAPLHAERLGSRGGPASLQPDPLVFYETSSYGPAAVGRLAGVVGPDALLYGSDRPVVEPREHGMLEAIDWAAIADGTARALGAHDRVGAR